MTRPARIRSRQRPAIFSIAVVVAALFAAPGCRDPQPGADDDTRHLLSQEEREALRLRAVAGFARGFLSKPAHDGVEGQALELAPLLIQATTGAAPIGSPTRIGAVTRGTSGALEVDVTRPAVYFEHRTASLNGMKHDQWSYVWWRARSATDSRAGGRQGIRMTLDADGSPFLWEVLTDSGGGRLLFVDRALEEEASGRLGPPHPGREYSLARTLEETPDVLIVRLIESGATPLGPFVHLGEDGRDVCTLLCRCMASEVGEIVGIAEYELVPLAELERFDLKPGWDPASGDLQSLLRFPPDEPRESVVP